MNGGDPNLQASAVRPLTRRRRNGDPYVRPIEIENEIAAAIDRPLGRLLADSARTSSECLVYIARSYGPGGATFDKMVMEILRRVERQARGLTGAIPAHRKQDVRDRVRSEFLERLFGKDDRADILEVRFGLAVKSMTIDAIRHFAGQDEVETSPAALTSDEGSDISAEEALDVAEFRANGRRMEPAEVRAELRSLTNILERRELLALFMVHYVGLKIESEDPAEKTAATAMNVSGRSVRAYLKSAKTKIENEKEITR